jgi:hypothetical protein
MKLKKWYVTEWVLASSGDQYENKVVGPFDTKQQAAAERDAMRTVPPYRSLGLAEYQERAVDGREIWVCQDCRQILPGAAVLCRPCFDAHA